MNYNNIENQQVVGDYYPDTQTSVENPDFYEASLALAKLKAGKATQSELNMHIDIIDVIESLPKDLQDIITAKQRAMMVDYLMANISR